MTRGLVRGAQSLTADVKQLDEAKKTLEFELEEIKSQLERDGYTSVAQMRCVFCFKLLIVYLIVLCLMAPLCLFVLLFDFC